MSHSGAPTTATSPKTRLQFLLDETPSNSRLPDRGRARDGRAARDATRALSADGAIGAVSQTLATPPPPRSLDWLPQRQHSADSLSSSGSVDLAAFAANAAFAHRDDSSESGSASGTSPRLRPLPAPSLLPAAHLLQSSAYGGVLNAYVNPLQQQPHQPSTQTQPSITQAQPQSQQQHVAPATAHFPVALSPNTIAPRIAPAPLASGSSVNASTSAAGNTRVTSARGSTKTEAQIRERHDQRKMKNRISAAASRDRKKRSFTNLQRSLHDAEQRYAEAKRVIEALTIQLEHARNRLAAGENSANVPVPQDLRHLCGGADYATPHQLVETIRALNNSRRQQ